MAYAIFLDDTRDPPMPFEGLSMASDVAICRSYKEFVAVVKKHGCPLFISFDHDLGYVGKTLAPSGMDCAKWLVNRVLDDKAQLPDDFKFGVHSMNPAGAANIQSLMDTFLEHMKSEQYGAIRSAIRES